MDAENFVKFIYPKSVIIPSLKLDGGTEYFVQTSSRLDKFKQFPPGASRSKAWTNAKKIIAGKLDNIFQ